LNKNALFSDNTLDVRLKKSLCGLGFSFYISELNSGSDQGSSVVQIKTLFQGQPAQESGQIREGDIILTVNGRWVSGLSYQVRNVFFCTNPFVKSLCVKVRSSRNQDSDYSPRIKIQCFSSTSRTRWIYSRHPTRPSSPSFAGERDRDIEDEGRGAL
uniref:PDZ domain-containing protein n=1 Tax=Oncorhynchus kisutch TaxID=8019 RepID=A0A8C7I684_ONCKI